MIGSAKRRKRTTEVSSVAAGWIASGQRIRTGHGGQAACAAGANFRLFSAGGGAIVGLMPAKSPSAALQRLFDEVGPVDCVGVEERVAKYTTRSIKKASKVWGLKKAVTMVDLTTLEGKDTPGATVGPLTTIMDSNLGDGVRVPHSYLVQLRGRDGVHVGPFAYLRPGTRAPRRAPRSARSWRSRTPTSATARKSRTCPTSATRTSARARTSAPARSPPTTTAAASTARRSATRVQGGVDTSFVAP